MTKRITIDSIFGGHQATQYFGGKGEFLTSIGIDPDLPISDSAGSGSPANIKTSGLIRPSVYTKFSSTGLSAAPKWILTAPELTNVYAYAADGELISYSSALGSESVIGTATSGTGNGAAHYNNYIYLATPTQIFRYGPLDGSPALSNALIANTELLDGWDAGSDTVLVDTSYPSFNSVSYPNHPMHSHVDNKLYVGDFKDGRGLIHFIKTTGTSPVGATNDGSTYNALDLPFGFKPYDIESYGTDLVILATPTTDTGLRQGDAELFFWDTTADSFYRRVKVGDVLGTALLNKNGELFVWYGNGTNGYTIGRYVGGETVEALAFFEEGYPPFAGAVDAYGNRVAWGAYLTYPSTAACVMSMGYKSPRLPRFAIHNIVRSTAGTNAPVISALKGVQQASGALPRFAVGWRNATAYGIDRLASDTTLDSTWRSEVFSIGQPFQINQISLPLAGAVAANVSITPKVYRDDESASTTLRAINNTNYTDSERRIVYNQTQIGVTGKNNFFLELNFAGSAVLPVSFPIVIDIELLEQKTA